MVSVLRLFDRLSREVDVFVRYYIPFEELWSNSESVKVGNQMARIAALEHVVQVKRTQSRPHDLADIEALTRMKNEQVDLFLREATPEDEPFLLEVYASTRIEELRRIGLGLTIRSGPLSRCSFLLVNGPIPESMIESFF